MVQERFAHIHISDDFVLSSEGATMLDAIVMRLQVIGESVKKLEKIDPALLDRYTVIEWSKISRFRDLVSHHYDSVDHEIIYDICRSHIPGMSNAIKAMLAVIPEMDKPAS